MAGDVLVPRVPSRSPRRLTWATPATLPAAAGTAAVLGAIVWIVLAASERASTLSPPTIRAPAPWLLGPLSGLLPGLTSAVARLHTDLLAAIIVASVGWALAWAFAPRIGARALLGVSALAQLLLVLGPPLPLTDVFNYELYARMGALHGLNPYRALPAAAAHDPAFALSNWHHLTSPYGPLFTLLTEALVPFGAHGWIWAWKAVVLTCGVGTVALVGAIAARLGVSRPRAIAALGLSPMLLVYEVGGLHQDVPAVLCLVAAAWCLLERRSAAAGALAVAAAGIKPSFAIVVGIVVLGAHSRPRALAGAAAAALATGAAMLVAFGGALPDVKTQGELVTPLSIPNLLGLAAGHGGADHAVRTVAKAAIVLVAAGGTVATFLRRERALAAIGVVLFAAVLALPWVMPWYLVWALPFVAVGRPRWLVPAVLVATAWLVVGGLPQLPGILHSFGYFPTRLHTGLENHLEFVRLLT